MLTATLTADSPWSVKFPPFLNKPSQTDEGEETNVKTGDTRRETMKGRVAERKDDESAK